MTIERIANETGGINIKQQILSPIRIHIRYTEQGFGRIHYLFWKT